MSMAQTEVLNPGNVMQVRKYDAPPGSDPSYDHAEPFGNVSRLKNVFQTDLDIKVRDSRKNAYNRSQSGCHSPETKRHCSPQAPLDTVDPKAVDPQRYFETTNHVQRFQHTRALFANMEKRSLLEQERQQQIPRGPAWGRTTSPTSPASNDPAGRKLTPPTPPPMIPPKPRAFSDSTRMNHIAESSRFARSESMESTNRLPLRQPEPRGRSVDSSGTDRSGGQASVSSMRWLRNCNEEVSHTYAAPQCQPISPESRASGRPTTPEPQTQTVRKMSPEPRPQTTRRVSPEPKQQGARRTRSPEPRPRDPLRRHSATPDMDVNRLGRNDKPVPTYRSRLSSLETVAAQHRSQEDIPANNIPQRNKKSQNERTDNGLPSSGVLLPKRRSRDEKGMPTKEEIQASLNAADRYWRNSMSEEDAVAMTESTHSSGSGEEMACSDSSHNTAHTPLSPEDTPVVMEVPRRNWSSLDNKARDIPEVKAARSSPHQSPLNSPRNSYLESNNTSCRSESPRTSQSDMEDVNTVLQESLQDGEYGTSHDSEESLSRSSSEASVKRNSVLEVTAGSLPSYESIARNYAKDEPPAITVDTSETDVEMQSDVSRGPLSPTSTHSKDGSLDQSMDSMTPSEQDNFPSKHHVSSTKDDLEQHSDAFLRDPETFLREREEGDGHEEPEEMVLDPTENSLSDSFKHNDDGSYVYEVEGLPETDPDDAAYPTAKRPARIKFSNAPIKVYSTYSVEEYDRKNEDVDPMAASAEYELEKRVERMDLFPVELIKGSEGLGLSIIGMGVGADAGLEKLGIFIKTLTEGGAAQQDDRIQVNDQIIEVDGKSLVGVTQAYAASVLRNTTGNVKFLIGREKNPQNSEVARLIQQSIEQDKRRAEIRQRQLDERQRESAELEQRQRDMIQRRAEIERDLMADDDRQQQQAQPPPMELGSPTSPSSELTSPEDETPAVEVFDLQEQEDSSNDVTPDMDPQVLFIKLKEAHYRNAVSDAELAKLKARMILLENAEGQRRHYEKKCEDMAQRLRESEKALSKAQQDLASYQNLLEGSQGQYITLEKQLHEQQAMLDKKYQKAKKLIKDYQQREKDFEQVHEVTAQIQAEKDQQYNELARKLKDRIIQLEGDLHVALKTAGLPANVQSDASIPRDISLPATRLPEATHVRKLPSTDNLSEISSDSDVSSPDISPV